MAKPRILMIEDDEDIVLLMKVVAEGKYDLVASGNGEEGYELARSGSFDLLILDVMIPGMTGLEICKRIREIRADVPIMMLTSMDHEVDIVRGFEMGADDYLTKPFSGSVLMARVNALLRRRAGASPAQEYAFGDARLHLARRAVTRAGSPIELTAKEFDLLAFLVQRPGQALGRETLLEEVWGLEDYYTTRTVDNYVLRLRKKIEPDPAHPRHILTLRGVGYKFEPEA